jgi:glycosyltransferase involved in cell wall biosynthesis
MEEVAGEAAVLVAPGDGAGLADAIEAQLAGPSSGSAAERRRRGLEIVSRHTWEQSAERHMDAFRHAAGRLAPPRDEGSGP